MAGEIYLFNLKNYLYGVFFIQKKRVNHSFLPKKVFLIQINFLCLH